MTHPKLELIDVRKEYDNGEVIAVDGIDLTVAQGETLALLGPSGCGKSTTLNMIVGLEQPTSGEILIDGKSVVGVPAGERNVGLVFQDYAVFTHMTVEKNLAFGLQVRGLPKSEVSAAVGEVAELLGLTELMKEKASRLGGSQLQRVAIGRTLVTKPSLLLLDEPLSNLEAETRASMRRELRRLQAETGLTIIYVTHDQIEALSLARRIAVMSTGHIRQCDVTDTVYNQPAHTFVAGFIGSPPMNLVPGQVMPADGGPVFTKNGFEVPVTDGVINRTAPHAGRVTFGVRPEAITLGNGPLSGTVTYVEPRGPEAVVTVDVAGTALTSVVAATNRPDEGEYLAVGIDMARAAFFDAETHRNLGLSAEDLT